VRFIFLKFHCCAEQCVHHRVTHLIGPVVCRTCTPDAAGAPEISWAPEITTPTTSEQWCKCNTAATIVQGLTITYTLSSLLERHVQYKKAPLAYA